MIDPSIAARMKQLATLALGAGSALALMVSSGPALADERPIPGAGEWRMLEGDAACSARLEGSQVDTMLMANKDGELVLVAGRRDWKLPPTDQAGTLQADDHPPRKIKGDGVANLILVLIKDKRLYGELRNARQITWSLPVGRFTANVTGLGVAFDASLACQRTTTH